MTLLQSLKLALKGFTSNNKQVFIVIVRKKDNEILDVTDQNIDLIKEVIEHERNK